MPEIEDERPAAKRAADLLHRFRQRDAPDHKQQRIEISLNGLLLLKLIGRAERYRRVESERVDARLHRIVAVEQPREAREADDRQARMAPLQLRDDAFRR